MSCEMFDRQGVLVQHGHDLKGRHDAIDFRARSGLVETSDHFVEAYVWVDRWAGLSGDRRRQGVASLLTFDDVCAAAMLATSLPVDVLYIRGETEMRLVFGEYIAMVPGARYRLFLEGAVIVRPTLRIVAQIRRATADRSTRRGWQAVRKAR